MPTSQAQPAVLSQQRGLIPTTNGVTPTGVNGSDPNTAGNPEFTLQVTFVEKHRDDMEIVSHPIEQGAPITDHSFKRPAELTLEVGWSESDPTPIQPINQIYDQLLSGQANRVLYRVFTGKRVYQNMLIKSLVTETDYKTANVLHITIEMQQVLFANTQLVSSVPAPASAQRFPQTTAPTTSMGMVQLVPAPNANVGAFPKG